MRESSSLIVGRYAQRIPGELSNAAGFNVPELKGVEQGMCVLYKNKEMSIVCDRPSAKRQRMMQATKEVYGIHV